MGSAELWQEEEAAPAAYSCHRRQLVIRVGVDAAHQRKSEELKGR